MYIKPSEGGKMKKRYSCSFDEEKTEYVRTALNKVNITMSGYLETAIIVLYAKLEGKGPAEGLSQAEIFDALHDLSGTMERRA